MDRCFELITSATVDLWETIDYHMLTGPDAVLEWVKGTALRPTLSQLTVTDNKNFLQSMARIARHVSLRTTRHALSF
jgi:trans-aconitate 2-methyltransferase